MSKHLYFIYYDRKSHEIKANTNLSALRSLFSNQSDVKCSKGYKGVAYARRGLKVLAKCEPTEEEMVRWWIGDRRYFDYILHVYHKGQIYAYSVIRSRSDDEASKEAIKDFSMGLIYPKQERKDVMDATLFRYLLSDSTQKTAIKKWRYRNEEWNEHI